LLARAPCEICEDLVGGNDPFPRVDEKDHEVGLVDGGFGLLAHARREPLVPRLEPRGINERHRARANLRLSLPPVASQAWLSVDQSEPLAGKPVEQGGLAGGKAGERGCICRLSAVRRW